MEAWLEARIQYGKPFTGEALEYVLGRAAKPETVVGLDLSNWHVTEEAAPCENFREKYGATGDRLVGSFMIPLRGAKGNLLGIQFQKPDARWMLRYLLPAAQWNPVFFGLSKAMKPIWAGAEVWLVEGIFDLTALEWALPPGHVVLGCMTAKLSDSQAEFLRRFASKVHIVFDADKIGKGASYKALYKLRDLGVPARRVEFSGGKDPGDLWDAGGEYAVQAAFQAALPVI